MENNEDKFTNNLRNNSEKTSKDNYKNTTLIVVVISLIIIFSGGIYFITLKTNNDSSTKIDVQNNNSYLSYRLIGNSLEDFDLYFLQLENEKKINFIVHYLLNIH